MSEKKDVQAELKESVNKIWLAGLGALSTVEEEGSKLFKTLVEKGEGYEARGKQAFEGVKGDVEGAVDRAKERATGSWDKVEDRFDDVLAGALRRFGVPNREEIATLTRRVEELTALVEGLKQPKKASKTEATPA